MSRPAPRARRTGVVTAACASAAVTLSLGLGGTAHAVVAKGPNLACGQVITASVTLNANLHCATGDGLIVDPDADVVLDLGGHTLSGSSSGTGITFESADYDGYTYTVQDGTVSGFGTGTDIDNIDNADVSGVKLLGDTTAVTIGNVVFDVTVSGSTIKHAQDDFTFDHAFSLTSLAVTGSTIVGGTQSFTDGLATAYYLSDHITDSALYLNTGGDDEIEHDVFTASEVQENSSGGQLQILDNQMTGATIGLLDNSLGGDTISGNTFARDGIGAEIEEIDGGGRDTVTGNTFRGNHASGLYVDNVLAGGDTVTSNTAVGNGAAPGGQVDAFGHPLADGLTIDETVGDAAVGGNHTKNNAAYGIYVDGNVSNGGGNTSKGDPDECAPLTLCTY